MILEKGSLCGIDVFINDQSHNLHWASLHPQPFLMHAMVNQSKPGWSALDHLMHRSVHTIDSCDMCVMHAAM